MYERVTGKRTGRFSAPILATSLALLMATSALAAGPITQSGGGYYETPDGLLVQVGGGAVLGQDGSVSGAGHAKIAAAGFHVNYQYVCLELHDNIMLDVGVVTSGNAGLFKDGGLGDPETGDLTGWIFAVGVEDNGEGAGADPDKASSPWWLPPEFAPEDPCDVLDFPSGFDDLTNREVILAEFTEGFPIQASPLLNGNFQIRE